MLALMWGQKSEVTKHTTQRTIDPTSVDFRTYYSNLLEYFLADKKRKIVLVIDNLDRVEAQTALGMWASMQTFVKPGRSSSNDAAKRVWVIVPYDKGAISNLWDRGDSDGNMGSSFTDKTFQIRYTVPSPLTTKWKEYFRKNLSNAIRDVSDDILDKIFHVFRNEGEFKHGVPTPREMKLYINRIVAIAQQHYSNNDASLEEIALYAAYEKSKPEYLENLANENINSYLRVKHLVGNNFKEGLAAIHYGVPRNEANEVLYVPKIEKALKNGWSVGLKKIFNDPTSQIVCDNYIKETAFYWPSLNELLKASKAFGEYTTKECPAMIRNSIKSLADHLQNIESEYFKFNGQLNGKNAKDLVRLIEFCPAIIPAVKTKLSLVMDENDYSWEKDETVNSKRIWLNWVKAVIETMKCIQLRGEDPTIKVDLYDDAGHYNTLLGYVGDEDQDMIRYFCSPDDLADDCVHDYCERFATESITEKDKNTITGFLKMENTDEDAYEIITDALKEIFPGRPANDVILAYEILFEHKDIAIFKSTLVVLAEDGQVFTTLYQRAADNSLMAYCLTNILLFNPDPQFEASHAAVGGVATFQSLLSDMDENLARETAQKITENKVFDNICNSVSDEIKNSKGFGRIIQEIVKDENMISCLIPERFVEMHDSLKLHLDKSFGDDKANYYRKLVKYLLCNGLIECLIKEPLGREYAYAYYIILNNEEIDTTLLEEYLVKNLNDTETDNWYDMLCNELKRFSLLDMVIKLVEKSYKVNLTHKFVDALIKHAKALLDKECVINYLAEKWGCLLNALTIPERKDFREKLLDLITDVNVSVLPLLEIYKDELDTAIEKALVSRKREFVNKICKRIATEQEDEEIKWMLELLSEKPQLLKKANKEDRAVIHDRLEDYLKNSNTETEAQDEPESEQISKEVIDNVAEQLGIELVQETPENNDESEDIEPGTDSE